MGKVNQLFQDEREKLVKWYEAQGWADIHTDEETGELIGWFKGNGPAYYLPDTNTDWQDILQHKV